MIFRRGGGAGEWRGVRRFLKGEGGGVENAGK